MAVAGDGGDAQRGTDALGLDVAFTVAAFGELVKPQCLLIEAEVIRQNVGRPFLSQACKLTAPVLQQLTVRAHQPGHLHTRVRQFYRNFQQLLFADIAGAEYPDVECVGSDNGQVIQIGQFIRAEHHRGNIIFPLGIFSPDA